MQTEAQQTSDTLLTPAQMEPAKDPFSWSNKEEREQVKLRVNKVSPSARTHKEKEILSSIAKEEAREDRVAACKHTLLDKADKWGRKASSTVTNDITSEVGKFSVKEKGLIAEATAAHSKLLESVRAKARREMAAIQERLLKEEAALDQDKARACDAVRAQFKPRYDQAATTLDTVKRTISDRVGKFSVDIESLHVDQLEKLVAGEKVTLMDEGMEVVISVPGTHKKELALVGEG